ncbi:MAG: hypothetical protein KF875_03095 [Trueperaceae bacterium]|nr:hypothetical protein [Trueperaceae bacterium]MCO5174423.1 hypothetical protein [Trueperaceae bacterium]MCW5819114.1 hypothetical protein [Trueperaceae bacterium]
MFKLGVVGHRDTLQVVRGIVEEYFDDVVVVPEEFGNDDDIADAVERIANLQARCDGILYSRRDPYLLVAGRLHHAVPVRYVDVDSSDLLISVLAATVQFGSVPDCISVDSFDTPAVAAALGSVGIAEERITIRCVSVAAGRDGFVNATLQQHLDNHAAGARLCITNITDVHHSLLGLGVPSTLISPAVESFVHEIRNLMLRHQVRVQDATGLAIMHIHLQYKERYRYHGTMPIREVDDLSKVAKLIAVFAEEVDSAMFQLSRWEYLILCSRSLLENATDRFANIGIMRDITMETTFDAAISIGCGQTVKQAEANAFNALNEGLTLTGTRALVVVDSGELLGPIKPKSERHPDQSSVEVNLTRIAGETGVGTQVLNRLYELTVSRNTSLFTSAELAGLLGVSTRTVNRVVGRLLRHGYAAVEGKDLTQGFGRPARVLRVRL